MAEKEVGQGYVAIVPSAKGFRKALDKDVDDATKAASKTFTSGFSKAGKDAGAQSGKGFASAFDQGADMEKMLAPFRREVGKASSALADARRKQADSAGAVRAAEAKLADAIEKSGAESWQAVSAEEKLEAARRRNDKALGDLATATNRVESAQQRLTDATREADGALERMGDSAEEAASDLHKTDRAADRLDSNGRSKVGAFATGVKGALGVAVVAAAAAATAALGGVVRDGLKGAMDLEQSVGAISSVFKDSAAQMLAWSEDAATAVGLSKNEYNELAVLIGAQLKNAGVEMSVLGGETNSLITLGADLASMFGGTTKDAVEALSSALKGERDPIEKYGVTLKQAQIDAEAAALGFEKVDGALSAEANAAATLSLIMKQTTDAHGNFAAEADTAAHKVQTLSAAWENAKTSIGQALLPLAGPALTALEALMPAVEQIATQLAAALEGVDLGPFITSLGQLAVMVLEPLIAAIPSLQPLFDAIGQVITALTPVLPLILEPLVQIVVALAQGLAPILIALIPLIEAMIPIWTMQAELLSLLAPAIKVVCEWLAVLIGWVSSAAEWFSHLVQSTWGLVTGQEGASQALYAIWEPVFAWWDSLWAGFLGVADSIFPGLSQSLSDGWADISAWFTNLPQQIADFFSGADQWLVESGQSLIGGFIAGIQGMIGDVGSAIDDLMSGIADFFPHSPAKKGPFSGRGYTTHSGRALVGDFADSISASRARVGAAAATVAATARDGLEVAASYRGRTSATFGSMQAPAGDTLIVNADGVTVGEAIDAVNQRKRARRMP